MIDDDEEDHVCDDDSDGRDNDNVRRGACACVLCSAPWPLRAETTSLGRNDEDARTRDGSSGVWESNFCVTD